MSKPTYPPKNKATALIAYILDMDTPHAVNRVVLDELVDAICENPDERSRLISVVSLSQSPEIRPQVLELLGRRLARLRDSLEEETDHDEIYGKWSQRVCGGGILAGAGAVIGGIATGGWAAAAIAAPLLAGLVATKGRSDLRRRARKARRACESTADLIELVRTATVL